MKILGLFIVVFMCVLVNKALGFSEEATYIGVIIGACSYVLLRGG